MSPPEGPPPSWRLRGLRWHLPWGFSWSMLTTSVLSPSWSLKTLGPFSSTKYGPA